MTELEYLEKLIKEKTPGPWWSAYHNRTEAWAVTFEKPGCDEVNDLDNLIVSAYDGSCSHTGNIDFIATMGTIAPLLLDVVKAVDELTTEIREYDEPSTFVVHQTIDYIEALKTALREAMK